MTVLEYSDVQPTDLTVKSIAGGGLSIDEAEGIVEFIASGIGNRDGVGDIVMPGAFDRSLKSRKPRVVWGHDWNHPIGKVLEAYELKPGDPRLPAKMKMAGIGGLYVKSQFNLKSEKGREAFSNVVFFGDDQEFSIGYKTVDAEFDGTKGANLLKDLELFEVSPVLHGANSLTGTIAFKSLEGEGDELIRRGLSVLKEFSDENPEWIPDVPADVKRQFSEETRRQLAEQGRAMDDGSYPIENESDLKNAIQAVGRAKDIDAAKRHIKKRASALNLENLLPDDWKSIEIEIEEKVGIPGAEPNVGRGEIAGGRGPRRGNLEDLLKYWRPIMKRPGGFRRCLVILADHPELYPLPNICAWLHHETTGKWPNEGNHHGRAKKGLVELFGDESIEVIDIDGKVVSFTQNDSTYLIDYVESEGHYLFGAKRIPPSALEEDGHPCKDGEPCVCGGKCKVEKSAFAEIEEKAGRVLSSRNLTKLRAAIEALEEVLASARVEEDETVAIEGSPAVKDALEVISARHGGTVVESDGKFIVEIQSEAHLNAVQNAVKSLEGHFINLENGESPLEIGVTE